MDTQLAQNAEDLNAGPAMKIADYAGIIEESAGRRRFCLVMNAALHDYEKRMLCDSRCPYTLPMHFITIEGTESAYYDFTGFLQLEEYIKRNRKNEFQKEYNHKPVCAALELLARILDTMKGMESYLLFPERFLIHPDTIFVHSNGHVSIACCKNETPESDLQGRIIALVENLIGLYQDHDAEQYLIKYKEMIRIKNPGLDGMISILESLKREVNYIYWNAKNFRKEDSNICLEYDSMERNQNTTDRNGHRFPLKQAARNNKLIAFQVLIIAVLIAIFLFSTIELSTFAGISAITAGADLWLMRKLRLKS